MLQKSSQGSQFELIFDIFSCYDTTEEIKRTL